MKARLPIALLLALTLGACQQDGDNAASTSNASVGGQLATAGRAEEKQSMPAAAPAVSRTQTFGALDRGSGALNDQVATEPQSDRAQPTGGGPLQNVKAASAAAMIIRTGQAFIEVEKVDPAILKIRQLAAQVGGYIANSSVGGGRDQVRQATLEIKIPAGKYDQAVGSLASIGKIETVNSQAQDVGEEFVDVTARVTNARRLEERLIALLANRTGKLDEVLRVERELARVREEIERYEGRLRYLGARVATSTLTITVHEPAPIIGNTPGENPIANAFRRAWRNFVGLIAAIIASSGVLIPLGLIAFAAWLLYSRWKRTNP